MKKKTFEAIIEKNGTIKIPNEVLKEMELCSGDIMEISYPCPSEAIERCIKVESTYHEENDGCLCIPNSLLEQCGMKDKQVHVICLDNEITITTTDKLCELVPSAVLKVLDAHQIPLEEVAKMIAEDCNGE